MRKAKLSRASSRPLQLRRRFLGHPVWCQARRPRLAVRFLVRRALPSSSPQQCLLRPQRVAHPHSHGHFLLHQALRPLKVLRGSSWRQHQLRWFRASVRGSDCRRLSWQALGLPRASPSRSLRRHLLRPQLAANQGMCGNFVWRQASQLPQEWRGSSCPPPPRWPRSRAQAANAGNLHQRQSWTKVSLRSASASAQSRRPPSVSLTVRDAALGEEAIAELQLGEENFDAKRSTYLVAFPHTFRKDLVAPETLSRREVLNKLLDSMRRPVYANAGGAAKASPVEPEKVAVAREKHKKPAGDGRIHEHDHAPVLAEHCFRFLPVKRALLQRHRLASHWSCTHDGYHSAVRYIAAATKKKSRADLDPSPEVWCRNGPPPPLLDQANEPHTAEATRRRREHKLQAAAEEGKSEPRATEVDLYHVIVEQGFRNTPDNRHAAKALIQHVKQFSSPGLFQFAFRNRARLSTLIDDVWSWETVDDTLLRVSTTRVERLAQACGFSCVCGGAWPDAAASVLARNRIDPGKFWHSLYMSLHDGRREDKPVMTCVGRRGGEGKSFLFSPLPPVYGADMVQATPQKGNYPLMDLEFKRVVVLDEWRFNDAVLSVATQLLWLEGKPILLTLPQNQGVSGHHLYMGGAPIFITTKEEYLGPLVKEAERAERLNEASEATMLLRRLQLFNFHVKLDLPRGAKIPACASCFARLVVHHASAYRQQALA